MPVYVAAARRLLGAGLAALFPADCLVCGFSLPWRQRGGVCHPCWERLPGAPGMRLDQGPLRALLWAFDYAGPARQLIHELKFRGIDYLGRPLGETVAGHLETMVNARSLLPRPHYVVPVPLHWWRLRRRGYNQATLIAAGFARRSGLPLVPGLLRRPRIGRRQLGLSRGERRRSLHGCFAARSVTSRWRGRYPLEGRTILLLDDVVTTGATLEACAAALLAAGAGTIIGCAVARTVTPRPMGPVRS